VVVVTKIPLRGVREGGERTKRERYCRMGLEALLTLWPLTCPTSGRGLCAGTCSWLPTSCIGTCCCSSSRLAGGRSCLLSERKPACTGKSERTAFEQGSEYSPSHFRCTRQIRRHLGSSYLRRQNMKWGWPRWRRRRGGGRRGRARGSAS